MSGPSGFPSVRASVFDSGQSKRAGFLIPGRFWRYCGHRSTAGPPASDASDPNPDIGGRFLLRRTPLKSSDTAILNP